MDKGKISSRELFSLIVLFELGSAIVVGLGMKAKQAAWLAILLGMIGGLIVITMYFYLYSKNFNLSLTSYSKKVFGKYIGFFIGLTYVSYFIYIAGRVLRDFGELVIGTVLQGTPLIVVDILMILSIGYGCYLGIEVLGRSGDLFFIVFIFLGVIFFLAVFSSGIIDIRNLFPVLEEGWKPVLTTVFPLTLTFPFGETIVFTMLFPYLSKPKKVVKVGYFAILLSGIILATTIAVNISVLGATTAANSTFPLLQTLAKASVGQFLQRMDPIAILMLVIGGFFKIVVFTYASVLGLKDLFNTKDYTKFIIPVCILIGILSVKMAGNLSEHIEIGLEKVPKYVHIPLQIGVPTLLCIGTFIKRKKEGRN